MTPAEDQELLLGKGGVIEEPVLLAEQGLAGTKTAGPGLLVGGARRPRGGGCSGDRPVLVEQRDGDVLGSRPRPRIEPFHEEDPLPLLKMLECGLVRLRVPDVLDEHPFGSPADHLLAHRLRALHLHGQKGGPTLRYALKGRRDGGRLPPAAPDGAEDPAAPAYEHLRPRVARHGSAHVHDGDQGCIVAAFGNRPDDLVAHRATSLFGRFAYIVQPCPGARPRRSRASQV